jgi:predicted transposase YbfD/YdcC
MARLTQAQKIESENEQQALQFFQQMLAELPDPRRAQGRRYPLISVIVIALMAMVCGSDDAESMELWGEANKAWLSNFLDLPHGVPSQDVFLAVFAALNPESLSKVTRSWAALLIALLPKNGKHIAVDGKTSRRSFDKVKGQPAIHTVSAFLSNAGLVLGEIKTATKSNEITAIPELLKQLDLRGSTTSIDAIGCQTGIAKTVIDGQGEYVLAVKENQPTLYQDIAKTFKEAADERMRTIDEQPRPKTEQVEDIDKNHGRIEERVVKICHDLSWLTSASNWMNLAYMVEVTRKRTILSTGKTSLEVSYYIGSEAQITASQVAQTIRRHWSIENELHWVLDMAFREDEARHRAKNTAQNMTILRHFALNLVKQDKTRKLGVANSRKRAGWDRDYLLHLLHGGANVLS